MADRIEKNALELRIRCWAISHNEETGIYMFMYNVRDLSSWKRFLVRIVNRNPSLFDPHKIVEIKGAVIGVLRSSTSTYNLQALVNEQKLPMI